MPDPNTPGNNWQQVPNTPPPGASPNNAPPPSGQQAPYPAEPASLTPNTAAALSYLTFIPAVIFLIAEPYKRVPFIRFHAIQCIALSVLYFIVAIIMSVLGSAVFLATPHGGFGLLALFSLVFWIIRILFFIAWLIAIYNASQGQWFKLPYIGDFAFRQAQR